MKLSEYVSLILPAILYSCIGFLGLVITAGFTAIYSFINGKNHKKWLRQIFSIQNIAGICIPGWVYMAYYSGNVFSEKPAEIGFMIQEFHFLQFVLFILASFGVYCVLIWKEYRQNAIFLSGCLLLILLPLFKMGRFNDLVTCASMPGMFIVMLAVTEYIFNHKKRVQTSILIMLLCVAAIYPMLEIGDAIRRYENGENQRSMKWETLEQFSDRSNQDIGLDVKYNYYSYDMEKSWFKYIARREME